MVAQILIDFPDCLFCLNLDSPDLYDYLDFKKKIWMTSRSFLGLVTL